MTESNGISTEPLDKSFDENIVDCDSEINYCNSSNNSRAQEVPKICFNQNCLNDGNKQIDIIGRYAGYKDYAIPYLVCEKCSSYLERRHEVLNRLINALQPHGEVHKTGVDIKNPYPFSSKMTVTTKDLSELYLDSQIEIIEEVDQADAIKSSIDNKPSKLRGCYNVHCSNEGTHYIEIVNSTTRLADHEIPYCICDKCYAFFEYRRKDPLDYPSVEVLLNPESYRGKEIEKVFGFNSITGKEIITTKDLYNLLESNRTRKRSVEE